MIAASHRIPNFAGIALVDILANGVAVLIIVIAISITVRSEQEKQYQEQVQEVATVMAREFSTSLVLNRLAASPPAVLHDYENSAIDSVWDPMLLPILEIHRDAVRDPYSGTIWSRSELLTSSNTLDDFLMEMSPVQQQAMRMDFYDVGTFYLLMSIFREHGVDVIHWHFVGGSHGLGDLINCPAGVSAEHCAISSGGQTTVRDIGNLLGGDDVGESDTKGTPGRSELEDGNGASMGDTKGRGTSITANVPDGVLLGPSRTGAGSQSGAQRDSSFLNNFPDVRSRASGSNGGDGMNFANDSSVRIRLADPSSQTPFSINSPAPPNIERLFAALMIYVSELQLSIDEQRPPTELLKGFMSRLMRHAENPEDLTEQQKLLVEDLTFNIRTALGSSRSAREPLEIFVTGLIDSEVPILAIMPNRLLLEAEARVSTHMASQEADQYSMLPDVAKPQFTLNAFPGIWRGLSIALEQGSVILMPPEQKTPHLPRWRAVAYVSSQIDDFVVGFVHASIEEDGRLSILGDGNRVRVGPRDLVSYREIGLFSVKTWLVVFYVGLSLAVLALLLLWRPRVRD